MKTKAFFTCLSTVAIFIIFCFSCNPKTDQTEMKIENTLKSVSFFYDSAGIDPHELLISMERINKTIDTIGYPDAGYKLWIVQSDTIKTCRFMIEGYWPDQAVYDVIHNNEMFKEAHTMSATEQKLWDALKSISYNRFILVK